MKQIKINELEFYEGKILINNYHISIFYNSNKIQSLSNINDY